MNSDKICSVIFFVASGLLLELGKVTVDLKNIMMRLVKAEGGSPGHYLFHLKDHKMVILFFLLGASFLIKGYFQKSKTS